LTSHLQQKHVYFLARHRLSRACANKFAYTAYVVYSMLRLLVSREFPVLFPAFLCCLEVTVHDLPCRLDILLLTASSYVNT
jgi:hypothetical protein